MIHIQPVEFVIRKYIKGSFEEKSPYDGIISLLHLSSDTCYIFGAKGDFNEEDFSELGRQLLELGYEFVYLERKNKLKKIKVRKFIKNG